MPDPAPVEPSFWSYARKALVALLVGVVAAGGVITAAVADDRITVSEWWTIGLAVGAAIVGPVGVYATRNASKPANGNVQPAISAAPEPLDGATPTVRGHVDGTIDLVWPDTGDTPALISRQLLDALVQQHNDLTRRVGQPWAPPEPRSAS